MTAARDGHALGAQAERLGASGERWPASVSPRRRPVHRLLVAYTAVGALAAAASLALERDPIACDGWLGTSGAASWALSAGLGVLLGAATIAATRIMVRRTRWARALHFALRPAAPGAGDAALLALAVASAAAEALLFRALRRPPRRSFAGPRPSAGAAPRGPPRACPSPGPCPPRVRHFARRAAAAGSRSGSPDRPR